MALELLTTATRGETVLVSFTLDLANGTDVTEVTTIAGTAVDQAGNEDDYTFELVQTGSTNVWTSEITLPWVETPNRSVRQTWAVRVTGTVASAGYVKAGKVVVKNWR